MLIISKIYWWVFDPSNVIFLILLLGTMLLWSRRWRSAGRRLVSLVMLFLLFLSVTPIDTLLIAPLENRFPMIKNLPADAVGIISLGGAVDQYSTKARDSIALTEDAERLTEFIALARRYPRLRLVYTGGSAALVQPDVKETLVARRLFDALGVPRDRISYENQSRNTHENAILTHDLMAPLPTEKWVLVTSARHMPRSVGVFRKAGWNIIPYPVAYLTYDGDYRFWRNPFSSLRALSIGMYEWVGLVAYRLLGRSDVLFPGP